MNPIYQETISIDEAEDLLINSSSWEDFPEVQDTVLGPEHSEVGVLLQHGFSGNNLEMLYLGNILAREGFRVLIPVLPGHGSHSDDLIGVSFQDWLDKNEAGYRFLTNELPERKIFAVGHSLGGAISLHLSTRKSLDGLVCIASPIRFTLVERIFVKIFGRFTIRYPYEDFEFYEEVLYQNPAIKHFNETYGRIPMTAIREVFRLLNAVYDLLPTIDMPISLMYSKNDPTVEPYHLNHLIQRIGSNKIELNWFNKSHHIVVIDSERRILAEKIVQYINSKL